MKTETKPEMVKVRTMDSNHHELMIKGMEMCVDVLTEKPITSNEVKCQAILDLEKLIGKKCTLGFNYRYVKLFLAIKEQLAKKSYGDITSLDFPWYFNTFHSASYFRCCPGECDKDVTLSVHKTTHYFDLLNWYIDSSPVELTVRRNHVMAAWCGST